MKQADKDKIRAALIKATGQDMGEIHPEFFLGPDGKVQTELPAVASDAQNSRELLGFFTLRRITMPGNPVPARRLCIFNCN